MLDENLPTFLIKHSSDNPLSSIVFFAHRGAEPAPEYSFKWPDPRQPQARNKYAVALADAHRQGVIFAEVLIEPEWQQASLSAAEVRALGGAVPPPVPLIPDAFTVQLYNPDHQITVRGEKSTWTGRESWEFEMPQRSFRMPSSSALDRESDPLGGDLASKILFRWKRDSKFSKDMTCYMCGKSLGGKKSKEPDITVALYKQAKEPSVTIYEPNLQRVEVEDRKGLEVALLLGAEVIRDIYLFPNRDSFNISGGALPTTTKRKNSRPMGSSGSPKPPSPGAGFAMSGGLGNGASPAAPPQQHQQQQQQSMHSASAARPNGKQNDVDAETQRLRAIVEREERERERQERAEQDRIKKMLEDEEREQQSRRDAEVARETERLRKEFGLQGQEYDADHHRPALPSRPSNNNAGPSNIGSSSGGGGARPSGPPQQQQQQQQQQAPPRPLSTGPYQPGQGPFHQGPLSNLGNYFFRGPSGLGPQPPPNHGYGATRPQQQQQQQQFPGAGGGGGRRRNLSATEEPRIPGKKRSVFF